MKDIIDAAAETARRTGAMIVVVGPQPVAGAPGGGDPIQVKHLQAQVEGLQSELTRDRTTLQQVLRERDAAAIALQQANAKITELQKAATVSVGEGASAALQQAISERDMLKSKVDELQGLVSQMRAQPGAVTSAPADPGAPEAKFATYGIEFLGLSEGAAKKLAKLDPAPKNVGDLLNALEGGKIASGKEAKPSFTKDEVIEIASKAALGRVPSGARAVPSGSAPANPGAATDVPAGHKDRGWLERLESARKKEANADKARADLQQQVAEQKRLETGEKNPDTLEALKKLQATIIATDKNMALYDGQVLAFLWALGLPVKDAKTGKHNRIDEALTQAGLVQLVQTAPPTPAAATV